MTRKLTRDTSRCVLGGVAAGFGDYLEVDPVLVRLAFILLVFMDGAGLLLYLACWIVIPRRATAGVPLTAPPALPEERAADAAPAGAVQLAIGCALAVVGSLWLAHNLGWLHWPHWVRFSTLWPLLLVALGLGLIARSRRSVSA